MKNKAWVSIPLTTTFAETEPLVQEFLKDELRKLKVDVAVFIAERLKQRSSIFSVDARGVSKDTSDIVRIDLVSSPQTWISGAQVDELLDNVLGPKPIPASHLRLSDGASVWTDDPNSEYCVIFRRGGPVSFSWHRSDKMTLAEANDLCAEYQKILSPQIITRAFVAKYAESMAVGLPETYD